MAQQDTRRIDPRWFQIASLSALLVYGIAVLSFDVTPGRVALVVAVAEACEWLTSRLRGLRFDPRSPLISSLSLALLLRTESLGLLAAAAAIAIVSKAVFRVGGKHLWNPTCLAIVALLATSGGVWVSAGQWGSAAFFGFGLACVGTFVIHRSARSDITLAFLASYGGLLTARALWLGDPLAIPLHTMQSGALLLFAFFMISDPRTTPDSRAGRIVLATAIAALTLFIQFGLYEENALLWSLALCAPLVPLLDRLLPGERFAWTRCTQPTTKIEISKEIWMQPKPRRLAFARWLPTALLGVVALFFANHAQAFCGFYVAKADTQLFNKASQVVLVRDGDRTILTMSNDYQGDPKEFAMVIPVPTFIEREQINVGNRAVIDHLDAYTAPRLVEYFDPDPCARYEYDMAAEALQSAPTAKSRGMRDEARRSLGVAVEASYSVGEYDIQILSAKHSDGLVTWLKQNGYQLPKGAEKILGSYLKQDMRFFVAKVNLEKHSKRGAVNLRPLQVAYESKKFMLPIRLGTLNAKDTQELFVYALTRTGRVETTNYRTVKLPTGMELPTYVKAEFGDFYRAMFDEQVRRERMKAVFLEYAWDMNWCDPCAADPLSSKELKDLGVYWVGDNAQRGGAQNVFVSRLHVRYDADHFPSDLVFQETGNRENFQGRYVMRHAFEGAICSNAPAYYETVRQRKEGEAQQLASLTGWSLASIREKLDIDGTTAPVSGNPWWQRLWK